MKEIEMAYALRVQDNVPAHITEVDRGGDCNCVCSDCGKPLIARQGAIKRWHFAHKSDTSEGHKLTACTGESALHRKAKFMMSEFYQCPIELPLAYGYRGYRNMKTPKHKKEYKKEFYVLNPEPLDPNGKYRYDIMAYPHNALSNPLDAWIFEIYVTHRTTGSKLQHIRKTYKYAVEIDLSDVSRTITLEGLEKRLLKYPDKKTWLVCDRYERENIEHMRKEIAQNDSQLTTLGRRNVELKGQLSICEGDYYHSKHLRPPALGEDWDW